MDSQIPNSSANRESTRGNRSMKWVINFLKLISYLLILNAIISFIRRKTSKITPSELQLNHPGVLKFEKQEITFSANFYVSNSINFPIDSKPFYSIKRISSKEKLLPKEILLNISDFQTEKNWRKEVFLHIETFVYESNKKEINKKEKRKRNEISFPLSKFKEIKFDQEHNLISFNKPISNSKKTENYKEDKNQIKEEIIGKYYINKIDLRFLKSKNISHELFNLLQNIPSIFNNQKNTHFTQRKKNNKEAKLKPLFYIDTFWLLESNYTLSHFSTKSLPLKISFHPISLHALQLQVGMSLQWNSENALITPGKEDIESFKRMLGENHFFILAITFIVTILHSIFDALAFKHDISFWRNRKDAKGISVQTIFLNCFCQLVIAAYLTRNEASYLLKLTAFVGFFIELWKLTRAFDFSFGFKGFKPFIEFRYKTDYVESGTAKYDRKAVKVLSFVLMPCVVCYSIYSLIFKTHRSWLDWFLSSLVGSVYTFGFITMCPQIYLNYKLKSVAHLPWKMLMFKFLNTIIDDLFAWVIKMPMLHRIACFRDDVIFVIYIYQRWIYRTDYSRENEFGFKEEKVKEE